MLPARHGEVPLNQLANEPAVTPIGVARLSKMMFDGIDLTPLWRELVGKYIYQRDDAAALMDLAVVEQLFGNLEDGLARQSEALSLCRVYASPFTGGVPRVRLLAFAAAGDIGTNIPLEFLLQGSDVALTTVYVDAGEPLPDPLPAHDLAIVAVGESDRNRPILDHIRSLTSAWPRPVLNLPNHITRLSRDSLYALLETAPGVVMPMTVRVSRLTLGKLAAGDVGIAEFLPDGGFPIIVRPVGSHAGLGLEKLAAPGDLGEYLATHPADEFYVSRFVDYSGADGLFRKFRVVFIEGRPYACHMAISDQWMIYYLNANMKESAAKRAEEERFMAQFDGGFAERHREALAAIAARVDLEYFGIDCAETRDGELLLFEADIAMIVHAMDDPALFPYKVPQMQKVFGAFCDMLRRRCPARPRPEANARP